MFYFIYFINIFFISRNLSQKLIGSSSSQKADIESAIAAIQQAIKFKSGTLSINTDSQFLINFTDSAEKWKKNDWRKSNNEPLKDVEDIKLLDSLCLKHKVEWVCLLSLKK